MNQRQDSRTEGLARALGGASLGLGAIHLAAPRAVCSFAGVDDSPTAQAAVPLMGARELMHAAVLLGGRRPTPWVWSRLAGDAMDLTALGRAMRTRRGIRRRRTAIATAAVAAITTADIVAASRALMRRRAGEARRRRTMVTDHRRHLHAAITVNRPREEVYRFWHDLGNLPRFMTHLESVETGDGRSHWRARGPMKRTVEWDAEIIEDRPAEVIAWRTTGDSAVDNAGAVRFDEAPGGRGTELRVDLIYEPPAGKVGTAFAKLMGELPEQQVRDDLRRLKQLLEAGEVVRSEGSPEGTRAMRQARQRPAQPLGSGSR